MAILSFDNYKDKISAIVLKKADKLIVRDFDEQSNNHFIAYVDEGDVSYDVSIEVNQNKEITSTACDCVAGEKICVHKIAFLNFYFNKKTTKTKVNRKKKLSEVEDLIEKINEHELKNWVLDLFKTNKDLELLFKAEFDKTTISYDKKTVKIIIDSSIKSIVKNRKNIDASEITKIIKLLDVSLLPVINYCKNCISMPDTHQLLYFIYNEIIDFHNRTYSSSIKLIRLYEKIYKDIILHIQAIVNQEQWEVVLQNYFAFFEDVNSTTVHFDLLFYFYESISDSGRKKSFAIYFSDIYKNAILEIKHFSVEFDEFALKVLSENQLFEDMYKSFKAIKYANKYNIFLIKKLLEINKIDEAILMADQQIQGNSNSHYDTDYYKVLESIYLKTNNLSGLSFLDIQLIQEDFSFERYLNIKKNWKKSEKEFVLFRTLILTKCRRNFQESNNAKFLYFDILNSYQNYAKMFENINDNVGYEVIFKFKEILFQVNSIDFLIALNGISYENSNLKKELQERENEFRKNLLDWVIDSYNASIISRVSSIKNRFHQTFFKAINQYFNKN